MEKPKIKILLAEDDPNLGTILKAYLEAKGFPTTLCIKWTRSIQHISEREFSTFVYSM
jgi:two-component system, OmpR family, response regulator